MQSLLLRRTTEGRPYLYGKQWSIMQVNINVSFSKAQHVSSFRVCYVHA